ncbi:MAG TPA: long-chain fatty acid--CoA ligase [Solirubrobacteraceae bacterium]
MLGLMQDWPLTLDKILDHAARWHGEREIVSRSVEGPIVRTTYAEVHRRAKRLSNALKGLGIKPGDRVATLAWNSARHIEAWYAIMVIGAVCHTLNPRLFPDQLCYIINHAEDQVLFTDLTFLPTIIERRADMKTVRQVIVMTDEGHMASVGLDGALCFETLVEENGEDCAWGGFDENTACGLCYTSGTTGNPKGVLYSHRSNFLHTLVTLQRDFMGLSVQDTVLAVVPMFHANAWGLPHGAALAGADLILPDRFLQAEPLAQLIAAERPTLMGCVPTIFADLLRYADEHPDLDLSSLSNAACGGSAVPRQLMRDFQERHGVRIFQAWGMTETSPVATYSRPDENAEHDDAYWDDRARQGRAMPWVELRLIGDGGVEVPWDGQSTGEIEVRGPWIAARYFHGEEDDEKFDSGWLRTGDIAAVDDRGYVQITDRSKDVIKSGGEWISSVELENEVMAHPAVIEAAVIARPDERWAERPLCCVVLREGSTVDAQELAEHLSERVAKWWIPEEFAFIEEVPKTSVGKFDKKVLRAMLADGSLEGRMRASSGGGREGGPTPSR